MLGVMGGVLEECKSTLISNDGHFASDKGKKWICGSLRGLPTESAGFFVFLHDLINRNPAYYMLELY